MKRCTKDFLRFWVIVGLVCAVACSQTCDPETSTETIVTLRHGGSRNVSTSASPVQILTGDDGLPMLFYELSVRDMTVPPSPTRYYARMIRCWDPECSTGWDDSVVHDSLDYAGHAQLGSDGLPIILLTPHGGYNGDASSVYLFHCSDLACRAGSLSEIQPSANCSSSTTVCTWTQLLIGVNGLPIIAYVEDVILRPGALHLYLCENIDCSHGSDVTVFGDLTSSQLVWLAVDGLPGVVFAAKGTDLISIRCLDFDCTSVVTRILVELGDEVYEAREIQAVVGADGNPIVAYNTENRDSGFNSLHLFHCEDQTCSSGGTAITVTSLYSVTEPALFIGDDGFPWIVVQSTPTCTYSPCFSSTSSSMTSSTSSATSSSSGDTYLSVLYKCASLDCSDGQRITLAQDVDWGLYASVAIKTDGLPIITLQSDDISRVLLYSCGKTASTSTLTATSGPVTTTTTTGTTGAAASPSSAPHGSVSSSRLPGVSTSPAPITSGGNPSSSPVPSPSGSGASIAFQGLWALAALVLIVVV